MTQAFVKYVLCLCPPSTQHKSLTAEYGFVPITATFKTSQYKSPVNGSFLSASQNGKFWSLSRSFCLFLLSLSYSTSSHLDMKVFLSCYSTVSQYGHCELAHSHMMYATFIRWCFSDPFPLFPSTEFQCSELRLQSSRQNCQCTDLKLNHPAFLHFYGNTAACQTPCPVQFHRRLCIRAWGLRQLGLCKVICLAQEITINHQILALRMVFKCHRNQTFMLLNLTRCHKTPLVALGLAFVIHFIRKCSAACSITQAMCTVNLSQGFTITSLCYFTCSGHTVLQYSCFCGSFLQSVLSQSSHTVCNNLRQTNTSDTFTEKNSVF